MAVTRVGLRAGATAAKWAVQRDVVTAETLAALLVDCWAQLLVALRAALRVLRSVGSSAV